jgi:hypothetical protein
MPSRIQRDITLSSKVGANIEFAEARQVGVIAAEN